MKSSSKRLFTVLMLFVAVAIFSMATVTASVASTPQVYATTEDSVEIETKYKKVSTYKITFNANGGKIGSKTKEIANIKKGSKIKKLPATPKRTGYVFKGWYTKKSGGTKVTVSARPAKNIILYAQWTKKASSKTLNAAEKKLVGTWSSVSSMGTFFSASGTSLGTAGGGSMTTYKSDGTYSHAFVIKIAYPGVSHYEEGLWSADGNTVKRVALKQQQSTDDGKTWKNLVPLRNPNVSQKYLLGTDERGHYIHIDPMSGPKLYKNEM